jgi:hypothetical protein
MRYVLPPLVGARPAGRNRKNAAKQRNPELRPKEKSMPKENDLEGQQDQGGQHGGQVGTPPPAAGGPMGQGFVRKRGEEQPRDQERAQQVSSREGNADEPPAS